MEMSTGVIVINVYGEGNISLFFQNTITKPQVKHTKLKQILKLESFFPKIR